MKASRTEVQLMNMYRGDGQGFRVANLHRKLANGEAYKINDMEWEALLSAHDNLADMSLFREVTTNGPF